MFVSSIFNLQLVTQATTGGALAPEDHNCAARPLVFEALINDLDDENMV